MPTYVYGCDTCGYEFEMVQKFHDPPLQECPRCSARVRKIFHPPGIVFKGSGWYSKDKASAAGATKSAMDDTTAKTGDGAATDGKSDKATKPAPALPADSPAKAAD